MDSQANLKFSNKKITVIISFTIVALLIISIYFLYKNIAPTNPYQKDINELASRAAQVKLTNDEKAKIIQDLKSSQITPPSKSSTTQNILKEEDIINSTINNK